MGFQAAGPGLRGAAGGKGRGGPVRGGAHHLGVGVASRFFDGDGCVFFVLLFKCLVSGILGIRLGFAFFFSLFSGIAAMSLASGLVGWVLCFGFWDRWLRLWCRVFARALAKRSREACQGDFILEDQACTAQCQVRLSRWVGDGLPAFSPLGSSRLWTFNAKSGDCHLLGSLCKKH